MLHLQETKLLKKIAGGDSLRALLPTHKSSVLEKGEDFKEKVTTMLTHLEQEAQDPARPRHLVRKRALCHDRHRKQGRIWRLLQVCRTTERSQWRLLPTQGQPVQERLTPRVPPTRINALATPDRMAGLLHGWATVNCVVPEREWSPHPSQESRFPIPGPVAIPTGYAHDDSSRMV